MKHPYFVCLVVLTIFVSMTGHAATANKPSFMINPDEYPRLKTNGSIRVDGFNVGMGPEGRNSSRFYASIVIAEGYKKKFSLSFRGHCDYVMEMNISIIDPKSSELKAYQSSQKFSDLKLEKPIDTMRKVLIEQCPDLSVLKVVTTKISWPAEVVNTLTLEKDKNWVYQQGLLATDYDLLKEFTIKFRDLSGMDVAYSGSCSEDIKLTMNHPKKGIRDPYREAADYTGGMLAFLNNFSTHCPGISQVNIYPSSLPMDYACESTDQCFVKFRKQNEWTVEKNNLVYREPESYTFDTILTNLASAPAKQKLDDTYKLFFVEYLEHVSRHCPQMIAQPENRVMIYEEVDKEFGTRTETGRVNMTIDSRLINKYLSYYDQRKNILFKRNILSIARARDSGRESGEMRVFESYYNDVQKLTHHFEAGCNSESVKNVYASFSRKHI